MISSMTNTISLIGTDKQCSWASKIIKYYDMLAKVSNVSIPTIRDATFWIENRNEPLVTLDQAATSWLGNMNRVSSPFSQAFPRYGKEDAVQALDSISRAIVWDCETSGLPKSKTAEIIEISLVRLDTGDVVFDSLIKPYHFDAYGDKASSEAISIHGISKDALETAPTLQEVWPALSCVMGSSPLVTYNTAFDFAMLSKSLRFWSIVPPRLYGTCAMKLYSAYVDNYDYWYKLEEACKMMNIDRTQFGDSHRSLSDVRSTIELLKTMQERGN